LTFDQPTSWLAKELARDPNLWDRAWTIEQLRNRPTDSAAAVALGEAADHADYSDTRAEAVEALAAFPGRWVASAVEEAIRDSAASVRRAACVTLAVIDSMNAVPRLRPLLHDRSYEVRAAALGALARIDSSNRSALIEEGLSTPSYQDVIQTAALRAAIAVDDSARIPEIDRLARVNRNAMMALGAFARRGNTHALELLGRALDDDRPFVRQSAVIAFSRVVPPAVALDALRGRVGALTHQDTHEAVERVIERLEKRASPGQP
jgi:HEAT repeat protein